MLSFHSVLYEMIEPINKTWCHFIIGRFAGFKISNSVSSYSKIIYSAALFAGIIEFNCYSIVHWKNWVCAYVFGEVGFVVLKKCY